MRIAPVLAILALSTTASAQSPIATDGTLGGGAVEVGAGTDSLGQSANYLIGAELGALRGDNLFHSFARFGISTNEIATFDGPGSVKNVIARVTGGAASNIDGTLRSTMPLADVWLLNPNGIVFGENAQIDVPGSFHASTADYLGFEDSGDHFYAKLQLSSVLSAAQPSAFGFLPETIAASPIEVNGATLSVLAGEALELVGDDITLTGADLVTDAGTILLRGGKIEVLDDSHVLAENVDSPTPGRIEVAASESLLVDNSLLSVRTYGAGNAGTIHVASPVVTFQNGIGSLAPAFDYAGAGAETFGTGAAGLIRIDADDLTIAHGAALHAFSFGAAAGEASGAAGTVEIHAHSLELFDRSHIFAGALGNATRGGTIAIDLGDDGYFHAADDYFAVHAGTHRAGTGIAPSGDAGTIAIETGSLVLEGAGINVDTNGAGKAGSISVHAHSLDITGNGGLSTDTYSSGNGGTITIDGVTDDDANSLNISNGGFINARTSASGDAGDIVIDADSIVVSGYGPDWIGADGRIIAGYGSRIITIGDDLATGDAGDITITTRTLDLISGGEINASVGHRSETERGGRAGEIVVTADEWIRLDGQGDKPFSLTALLAGTDRHTGIVSVTVSGSDGGAITLDAPEITATNGAFIATATIGGGRGGDLNLSAGTIRIVDGAAVSTSSLLTPAPAGRIELVASDSIEVIGFHPVDGSPTYVSSGTTNSGSGGDVTLRAPRIVLDGGLVTAGASPFRFGESGAPSGNIRIEAGRELLVRGGGQVGASTFGAGAAGDIDIHAGESIRVEGAGSIIASRTGADGRGGNVVLQAPRIELANGGRVSASSEAGFGEVTAFLGSLRAEGWLAEPPDQVTGNAGSITIEARDLVHLDAGTISTSVGSAAGGDITIDPTFVILERGSQIVATAGTGSGGHISIDADHFFAFPGSIVSAASGNPDLSGTVEIASPDVDLAGSITPLPSSFLDAASQMQQSCAARRGGERAGTFAVRGAGGIPAEPDGWLPAPVVVTTDAIASAPGPMLASVGCP